MADKAFITPNVLKWARESARMTVDVAAAKVSVSMDKLQEWEQGTSQPTIRQAETLAKAYRRPFALFFLPEIPRDFLPLQDFRRQTARSLSTGSVFIIREIQQKQAWMSEVSEDNEDQPLAFVGKFNINSDPKQVAADILKTLQINPAQYTGDNPFREWLSKAEAKGIFISRTSFTHSRLKIDTDEIQGFAIADKYAPFVFINSGDWDAPQLFTLVHELAHIWIATSGISNDVEPQLHGNDKLNPVELFCNEVAANALMPDIIMNTIADIAFASGGEVFKSAKKLGISSFALLVRALNMRVITTDDYKKLKQAADQEFRLYLIREEEKKIKQKEKRGGPDPYLLRLNKNSRLFTQIVLDAFRGGLIPPAQASSLLNTQVNNFAKLEVYLHS